ncbi:type 1 glutamine amidotransferase [Aestuariimicrobium sp. p3-SID1156]|uniref:type 1 glutamine amidotransferase n=1 Tax=Aestuariimicrobium sp. p3-SID1156 TaxID=2916038 RepID=UPI00223AA4DC|nr:type 1 glutamine amidotransferase [Aestuariimicrobium sp. p3-SID1156]MCT1459604.1 type 1 glutamine amidotransferase [Aestuariimicrobium sp. p3-SID1156]
MAKKPRITVLQPESDVPLDRFEEWLARDVRLSVIDLQSKDVPNLDAIGDGLVVLGGRTSAHAELPWMGKVKDLMADLHAIDIPILGICLGHQLLAEALGGRVNVGDPRGLEEGALELHWAPAAAHDPVVGGAVLAGGPVPMSHYDNVVQLPEGATELARTATYENAAFRLGSAWGVQFHPEASPELMQHWWKRAGHKGTTMLDRMTAADRRVEPTCRAIAEGFTAVVNGDA